MITVAFLVIAIGVQAHSSAHNAYYTDFEFETFAPMTRKNIKRAFRKLSKGDYQLMIDTVFDESMRKRTADKFEEPRVRLCFELRKVSVFVDKPGNVSYRDKSWKLTEESIKKLSKILGKYPQQIDYSVPLQ